jgi:hypothetical protein
MMSAALTGRASGVINFTPPPNSLFQNGGTIHG